MASIGQRPYVGTWRLNNRQVVKYTPDALVFINGDVSVPGCPRCRGRVDIQNYVTGMSVDAGTTPTSHSATINLTLPRIQGQQIFVDGTNILRPGLEVHIFMRGYFPVRGMFSHLGDPQVEFPNSGDNQLDLSNYSSYPYYPVFHGVIINSSYEYSDGSYYGTLNCSSLLHFWAFQNASTSAAYLATAPINDTGRTTLFGHNFNNMHPYAIMYTLYRDVAGAAAAVEFALDETSNLTAFSNQGEQLYDQVTLYWEQRFKTRLQSLRMYGVNGQLFNAVQQAFLSKGSHRDGAALSNIQYGDAQTQSTEHDPFSGNLSVAKALGLDREGTDFIFGGLAQTDGNPYQLNVLDIFAFDLAIQQIGDVNLWESTYQTKNDIANRVCEVTGFEFYQDVDGDLVFKPPFYNLDTANNRFYVLEDIDIITISFNEKEPQATYLIVRGSWIKGIKDVAPNSGATGKRALFIDYKLVAQFGWRAGGTLDLTYATDPKVLFWIAVARLDLLNIDINSASVTIPIRAEMRPGYPVYIPFADCYYYISQISHTFSFGGSCTTNLVLTCRRAKFHAPGRFEAAAEGESAVKLIELNRPDRPKRPLEIHENGRPRLTGFPNVVMALEPKQINPAFTVVGSGISHLNTTNSKELFDNLMKQDISNFVPQIFEVPLEFTDTDGRVRRQDPANPSFWLLRNGPRDEDVLLVSIDDFRKSFGDYQSASGNLEKTEGDLATVEASLQKAIQAQNAFDPARGSGNEAALAASQGGVAAAQGIVGNLEQEGLRLKALQRDQRTELAKTAGTGGDEDKNLFLKVAEAILQRTGNPVRRSVNGIPQSDVTASYFESLQHLKSQFMPGRTLPGRFRYYSSAHPDPEMQGQPLIVMQDAPRANSPPGTVNTPPPGKKNRRGRRSKKFSSSRKGQVQKLNTAIENTFDIPGWADFTTALVSKESGFALNSKTKTRSFINGRKAVFDGKAFGNRSAKQNQKRRDRWHEYWGDNIERNREDWLENAVGGWYQFTPSLAMKSFKKNKGSRHYNINPKQAWFDPKTSTAAYAGIMRRQVGTPAWNGKPFGGRKNKVTLPPECLTYLTLARNYTGAGFFVASARRPASDLGSACHVLTVEEARQFLVAENPRRPGRIGKKIRDPDSGEVILNTLTKDTEVVVEGKVTLKRVTKSQIKRSRNTSQGDLHLTAGLLRSLVNTSGLTLEQAVALLNQQVPAGLKQIKGGNVDAVYGLLCGVESGFVDVNRRPPPPAAPSPPAQEETGPELVPEPGGIIETVPLALDTPRKVIQFKEGVTNEPGRRPPEAELGVGDCSHGLNISFGPNGQNRLLTTDQIQTISFVQYPTQKNTEVIGTSQTAGRLAFNTEQFANNLTNVFAKAAQGLVEPEQTPESVWGTLWEQIRTQIVAIPIPVYENGNVTNTTTLDIGPFGDALPSVPIPATLQNVLGGNSVPIATTSFGTLSQLTGYAQKGSSSADGQELSPTVRRAAGQYAKAMAKFIAASFNQTQNAALEPALGKNDRLGSVRSLFDSIAAIAAGTQDASPIEDNRTEEKTPKQGCIDRFIHSPVFPVSDEKGYEHFGAFRYGRGLTTEPGGTFEFIHRNGDPLTNVSPEDAELFLSALERVKGGKSTADEWSFKGAAAAGAAAIGEGIEAATNFLTGEEEAPPQGPNLPTNSALQQQDNRLQAGLQDANLTAQELGQDPVSQQALVRLLEGTGSSPQQIEAIRQNNWDISGTQLQLGFANSVANYARTPTFKTTAANAAYNLTDLTSHLLARAGSSCRCRGALADVVMEAFTRRDFVSVEGIDQRDDPAAAFASESMIRAAGSHRTQQNEYTGAEQDQSVIPDAAAFTRSNSNSGSE